MDTPQIRQPAMDTDLKDVATTRALSTNLSRSPTISEYNDATDDGIPQSLLNAPAPPSVRASRSASPSISSPPSISSQNAPLSIKPSHSSSVGMAAPVLTTGNDAFDFSAMVRAPSPMPVVSRGRLATTNDAVSALRDASRRHDGDKSKSPNKPKSPSKSKSSTKSSHKSKSHADDSGDDANIDSDIIHAEELTKKSAMLLIRTESRCRKEVDLKPAKDLSSYFSSNARAILNGRRQRFHTDLLASVSPASPKARDIFSVSPHPDLCPIRSLNGRLSRPDRFKETPNHATNPGPATQGPESWARTLDNIRTMSLEAAATAAMSAASDIVADLNRLRQNKMTVPLGGPPRGGTSLTSIVRSFVRENLHPFVPYAPGPEVSLTCGETDGLVRVLDAFVPTSCASAMLAESHIDPRALSVALARNVKVVVVGVDEEGMLAFGKRGLFETLAMWDSTAHGCPRPHLLYISTIGANPSTTPMGHVRRAEIYAVCRLYNVLIIEDEPHWYLQYPSALGLESAARDSPRPFIDSDDGFCMISKADLDDDVSDQETPLPMPYAHPSWSPFLASLVPSFLRYDSDGRVIRLDSFSNSLLPGCQLGWITAQPAIAKLFDVMSESRAGPSTVSQSAIVTMLSHPSYQTNASASVGLLRSLAGLRAAHESRMKRICTYLEAGTHQLRHGSPTDTSLSEWGVVSKSRIFSFSWPRAGPAIWIRVHFAAHPCFRAYDSEDSDTMALFGAMFLLNLADLVSLAPASALVISPTDLTDDRLLDTSNLEPLELGSLFRFSLCAEDDVGLVSAAIRFVKGAHVFWGLKQGELDVLAGKVRASHGV